MGARQEGVALSSGGAALPAEDSEGLHLPVERVLVLEVERLRAVGALREEARWSGAHRGEVRLREGTERMCELRGASAGLAEAERNAEGRWRTPSVHCACLWMRDARPGALGSVPLDCSRRLAVRDHDM